MSIQADDFKEFLENYKTELNSGITGLVVDFEDLDKYNKELAKGVLDNPSNYIRAFKKATLNFSDEEVDILIKNCPRKVLLYKLGSEHLGKLISINGIISRVLPTRPMISNAAFKCRKCGEMQHIVQSEPFLVRPDGCSTEKCGSNQFRLLEDPNETTYFDVQELSVQDKPEDLKSGQSPQLTILEITKKSLINKVQAGNIVDIVGILKTTPPSATTHERKWDLFVDVLYINSINKDPTDIELTKEEEDEIRWLASDSNVFDKIQSAIAPSIFGCELIKEAIMYQLFGGREKHFEDRTVRGNIHILWIDDPSKAKSQVLMAVKNLAPRGLYVAGGGASGAGLTAAVVKVDKERWAIEAGAVVLANNGICCIDEIEKMNKDDRKRIHEAMAQQMVNIQKANVHYTLPAKTAILAAGNPKMGRYDDFLSLKENITLPTTIISRFDLIFIGRDVPDAEMDELLAEHILEDPDTYKVLITKDKLRKYIALAKRINPILSNEAKESIKIFYRKMRMASGNSPDSPITITARQLDGLVRISEAHARIRLSKTVDDVDAQAAIKIMMASLKQAGIDPETGEFDVDNILTGSPKTVRERMSLVMNLLADGDSHSEEEIIELLTSKGVSLAKAKDIIIKMDTGRAIYSPSTGRYKKII